MNKRKEAMLVEWGKWLIEQSWDDGVVLEEFTCGRLMAEYKLLKLSTKRCESLKLCKIVVVARANASTTVIIEQEPGQTS